MEVLLNKNCNGFSISEEVCDEMEWHHSAVWENLEDMRTDIDLIKSIKKVGFDKASADFSEIGIVNIPDGTNFKIIKYEDGSELIIEEGHYWC
jgi:hypothetical protein